MKKTLLCCLMAATIAVSSVLPVTASRVLSPNGHDPKRIDSPSGNTRKKDGETGMGREDGRSPKTGDDMIWVIGSLGIASALTSICSIRYSKKEDNRDEA